MRKSVLLLATALVAVFIGVPVAGAQTESDLGTEAIDNDAVTDRVGLVDPSTGVWSLRGPGGVLNNFLYGNPGDFPMVGDWNCDGIDTPGLYRQSDGFVYLRNSNTQGVADIRFFFGNPSDIPLAGDFNGDGCDSVSIYRPAEGRIYVINKLGANEGGLGAADFSYLFGDVGDKPFVGDFNGDGIDTVGLHRESTGFVYFRQSLTTGIADSLFFFGDPGDRLVAGDWGVVDNVESPGLFRPSVTQFFFRYSNTQGNADEQIPMGSFNMLPVAGAWEVKLGLGGVLSKQVVGIPFAQQLSPVGGTPPYTVTKLGGPAFLSVNNSGVVFGTPPSVGAFNLTVSVTDSTGKTADQTVPLTVQDGCDSRGATPHAECLALVDIYRKTGGNGWATKTNWFATSPCSWYGITCHASGSIAHIVLENEATVTGGNNLVGSISTVPWQNLPNLQIVNLQHNTMTGALPASLAASAGSTGPRRVWQQLRPDHPDVPGAGQSSGARSGREPVHGQHRRDRQRDRADAAWTWPTTGVPGDSLTTGLTALTNMLALQIVDLSDNEFTVRSLLSSPTSRR